MREHILSLLTKLVSYVSPNRRAIALAACDTENPVQDSSADIQVCYRYGTWLP